jgi:hypothetical protein
MKVYTTKHLALRFVWHSDGRKAVGGSFLPFGHHLPWVSVYLFGLYVSLNTQFMIGRKHKKIRSFSTDRSQLRGNW